MKIIGLTGSIATGKSTVSTAFSSLGIPVIDADKLSREIVAPGQIGYYSIINTFGDQVLDETRQLNRAALADIIYQDSEKRKLLNEATHPYIRMEMLKAVLRYFIRGCGTVILDTPLLFETRLNKFMNTTIVVYW